MNRFQEMVRARLREKTPSLKALADFLGIDSSIIQRRFKEGGTSLCLDFLDDASPFYQMSVSEMTAMQHSLWQEVKPLEAAMLSHFRQMTELERRSLLTILERPIYAAPNKKSRIGRAMLTVKEQELVDLFGRVKRDGVREGVLRTLKGAAQDDETAAPVKDRTTG